MGSRPAPERDTVNVRYVHPERLGGATFRIYVVNGKVVRLDLPPTQSSLWPTSDVERLSHLPPVPA